jgi:hypothetical protein
MLLGSRTESRPAETFAKMMMKIFGFLFVGKLKKFRGIHAQKVAKAMIHIINQQNYFSKLEKNIFESNELMKIAENINHDKQ